MLAVNYSTLRNNLKSYCDRATDDAETVFVTRKDEKNLVMMSLESYNNLMENIFVRSNHKNYQHITEGIRQLEGGNTDRLIYRFDENTIYIAACKGHYT